MSTPTSTRQLAELLRQWLPEQRWFGGKGRELHGVRIVSDVELAAADPAHDEGGLRHVVAAVEHGTGEGAGETGGDGDTQRYQILLGLRSDLPQRLRHAVIGWCSGTAVYDAVQDSTLTRVLLSRMAARADIGDLRFRTVPGAELRTDTTSLVVPTEQSNTSFVYDEDYICKLFRRLEPGPNPDLEMSLALARAGSPHVAPPLGWIDMDLDGVPTTLAMLQTYLPSASEGWALAVTSVRDLYAEQDLHADEVGGDFAAEARRLGAATAAVHRDLARAFPTDTLGTDSLPALAAGMRHRLEQTCAAVPSLSAYAGGLAAAYDALATLEEPVMAQRVHGDYHLGQVVRTDRGWVLLDFEGEPLKTLAERRMLASPLRDVAGMLRSFDYAARHLAIEYPDSRHLEHRAREWADRNRGAFCAGYAAAGGLDPEGHRTLVRAFEFDKAVYEVMYEARNRPTWLRIPLASIARMVD